MRPMLRAAALAGSLMLPVVAPAAAQRDPGAVALAEQRARIAMMQAELEALSRMGFQERTELVRLQSELARIGTALPSAQAMLAMELAARGARVEAALAAARPPGVVVGGWGRARNRLRVPEPWLGQDPADSLYQAARQALNRRDYRGSADLFRQIRDRYPSSGYVGPSFYFEALALQRVGGTERLEEGLVLLDTMLRDHPDAPTRDDARALRLRIQASLAQRGDAESALEVTEQAAQSCEGEDQDIRAAALSALLQMDADRATPILKEVLRDRDQCSSALRQQAVFILARKAELDPETVDLLVDLAYRNPDPDPKVRQNAVFWLSQVPSEEALDALASILEAPDADESIQETAIQAVSRHESPRAGEILRSYAERDDAPRHLRENAIVWLGHSERFGGGAYLRGLYARVQDRELRERIVFAVARAGGEESGPWLLERARDTTEDADVRRTALFWAGRTGAISPAELRGMYGTFTDPELKEQLFQLLAQEDSPESVDALMEIAESEEDPELRARAVFWLGRSDDPRVADFLVRLIRGGSGG